MFRCQCVDIGISSINVLNIIIQTYSITIIVIVYRLFFMLHAEHGSDVLQKFYLLQYIGKVM